MIFEKYVRTCKTCKAEVIFAKMITGKWMPVDRDPVDGGNIQLVLTAAGPVAHVKSTAALDAEGVSKYISHFVSCRDAAQHRKMV